MQTTVGPNNKAYIDPKGQFICDLTTNGRHTTLANIYAPNENVPNFFTSVFNQLLDFKCKEIIVGGDFNLVLDVNKDKKVVWPEPIKNCWK